MAEREPAVGNWEQLNRCPDCGADMERLAQVGEQVGLYYRCPDHGRFRYSWDHDKLERVPSADTGDLDRRSTTPNSTTPNAATPDSRTPDSTK